MGATNNIKGVNGLWQIKELKCSQCSQQFTEEDYKEENFDLWFDTSGDTSFTQIKEAISYGESDRWLLSVAIRDITHKLEGKYYDCPDTEECQECFKKGLTEKMLYIDYDQETGEGDEYFCNEECYRYELEKRKKAKELANLADKKSYDK